MVGVPGRSKACGTCKQRRIACSLERPECAQCVKSKRVCTGYRQERIFILHEGNVQPKYQARTLPREAGDFRSADPNSRDMTSAVGGGASIYASLNNNEILQEVVTKTISLKATFRQQILSKFLDIYVPASSVDRPQEPKEHNTWLSLLLRLPLLPCALETAIIAISATKLGRLHENHALVQEGWRIYGQGLWELQKALWDAELMYKDETLAACMALSMYEVIECPTKTRKAWLTHMNGCAKLVELRGVKSYTSGFGHQLFLTFRKNEIIHMLGQHRSTYLSNPEWMEIPWKYYSKSPLHQLLDLMAVFSNILAQAFQMDGLESTDLLDPILTAIDSGFKIDAKLQQWYKELQGRSLGMLYWPMLSVVENPTDDPELGKVFPVAFHFSNLVTAETCLLYWTTQIMLWSGLSFLYGLLATIEMEEDAFGHLVNSNKYTCLKHKTSSDNCGSKNETDTPRSIKFDMRHLPPLEHRLDLVSPARNICQSVEYCMQDKMREVGLAVTSFPLRTVTDVLKDYPDCHREVLWARAVLERANYKSFRLLKYYGTDA